MKIGQAVFQEMRRYGIVEKTMVKDRWTYAIVKWFNDEKYDRAMNDLVRLRNGTLSDFAIYEYRVDSLRQIDVEQELKTLRAMQRYQKKAEGA